MFDRERRLLKKPRELISFLHKKKAFSFIAQTEYNNLVMCILNLLTNKENERQLLNEYKQSKVTKKKPICRRLCALATHVLYQDLYKFSVILSLIFVHISFLKFIRFPTFLTIQFAYFFTDYLSYTAWTYVKQITRYSHFFLLKIHYH